MDIQGPALVVGTDDRRLLQALEEAGYRPRALPAAALADGSLAALATSHDDPPAAVFIDAACSPADVRGLLDAVDAGEAHRPAVIVTTTGDPTALTPHLAAGLDALLPPYLPALLRSRVEAAGELGRLSAHAQDLLAEAHRARMDKELQIGRDIQQGFLPRTLPERPGWDVAARFRPAREVAGDFYDAFEMVQGRRIGFVVADVCDKGVGAALFMALIRTLVRQGAQQNVSMSWVDTSGAPQALDPLSGAAARRKSLPSMGTGALMNAVAGANHYMTENHLEQGYFATMFMAMLDPKDGSVSYINGGHNPPVLVREDGSRISLPPSGPAVGMMPGVDFHIRECRLEPGDTLFIYTDGVPEAKDESGHFFGDPRMHEVLTTPIEGSAELLDRMDGALRAFVGEAAPFDDITMLAVRRLPDS